MRDNLTDKLRMALNVICHRGNQAHGKPSSTHLSSENPNLCLEVVLVTYALLNFVSWYMDLSFLEIAFIQAVSSLIIFKTWTHGQLQIFAYTSATWTRHKVVFVEFCVLVFISCATLNTLLHLQERSAPASHIVLVILRSHPFDLIVKLDLAAVAAITACHLCGHHDFCDRVVKRSCWLGSRISDISAAVIDVILITLQELPSGPLDQQSRNPQPTDTSALHQGLTVQRRLPKLSIPNLSSESTLQGDELHDMDFNARLISMWRMACFWASIHGELRKVGAKVRWSAVRIIFEIAKSPVEVSLHLNLETDGAAHAMSLPVPAWEHHPAQSALEIPGRSRRSSSATTSPQSFKSAVMQAMEPANKLKILRARPSNMTEETQAISEARKPRRTQQSYPQLPGYINGKHVDALPDTGSSQNLINAGFLNSLDRSGHQNLEGSESDRPLVAPDGGEIPSSGTVELAWRFYNEHEDHGVVFNIVQNCSHDVIIGYDFLARTKTLDEEFWVKRITTHPVRNDSMDVPSNSGKFECTRRVVNGFVDQNPAYASLDTGCEANLMSEACAQQLHLEIQDLPSQHKEVTFANGRQAPLKGQVTFLWEFAEHDSEPVSQTCFILENCIHPIIFGVDFAIEYKLFHKHPSVIEKRFHGGLNNVGVVGQKKGQRFSFFRRKKADDPVELREQQKRDEKHKRLEALLDPPATVTTPTSPPPALIAHSGRLPVVGGPVLPLPPALGTTTSCIQHSTPPSPSSAAPTLPSTSSAIQPLASTPTTQSSTQQATAGTTPMTCPSSPIPSKTTSPPSSRPASPQSAPSNTQSSHPSNSVSRDTSVTLQSSVSQFP